MSGGNTSWRIYTILLLLFLMGAAITGRLFLLQVVNGSHYKELAGNQQKVKKDIKNERGNIFIHDKEGLFAVAVNREWPMAYLVPKDIKEEEREEVALGLSEILEMDKEEIMQKINKIEDPYEPLANRLDDEAVNKINELDMSGVGVANESLRYYPLNNTLSHALGFVGFSEGEKVGQYGVEGFYEKDLRGEIGQVMAETDALGRIIGVAEKLIKQSKPSKDIVLTVDKNVQFAAEEKLKGLVEKWEADSGGVIIMSPKDGSVMAMASYPDFNLNEYFNVEDINVFSNPLISGLFEPGSVFKPITMAAAIDSKKMTRGTVYFDEGFVKRGGYTIKNSDSKSHGNQTMTEALEKSLNTGAVFAAELLDKDEFLKYVKQFGFGSKTKVDLAGETNGNISNLYFGRDVNYATASFGQGIAVTPMELISAISAIANGGLMARPHILDGFLNDNDELESVVFDDFEKVISPDAANSLSQMMVSVVENGYGSAVQIPGYYIAGKTGTAQVPSKDSKGYGEETIHAFVGFAPAYDPRFAIVIKIDNPKDVRFAASSVGPSFRQLTEFMLNYYGIAPDYEVGD